MRYVFEDFENSEKEGRGVMRRCLSGKRREAGGGGGGGRGGHDFRTKCAVLVRSLVRERGVDEYRIIEL